MPVDHGVYGNIQNLDIMGNVKEGMRLKDMMEERSRNSAVKDAYSKNTTVGEDGKVNVNRAGLLSDLAKASPEAMMKQQGVFSDQDRSSQELAQKKQMHEMEMVGRVAGNIKDQASYDQGLTWLARNGVDVSSYPKAYDKNLVDRAYMASMSVKEQREQQMKDREYGLKEQELGLKRQELQAKNSKAGGGAGDGFKTLNREYAKDHNQWTSGGANSARLEIQKLKDVAQSLKDGAVTTGGLTGMFPDRMTSDSVLKARADVQSTVMNSLRPILGAQFTEKEGERIIKNTWNESDSTENNLARINRLIEDLETRANEKDAKSNYFEGRGTLQGFRGAPTAGNQAGQNQKRPPLASAAPNQVFSGSDIDWK